MIEVKVCGITNAEDARLAVELGAAMLGFNFYPRSLRYIAPSSAAPIIARLSASVSDQRRPTPVGVFVNASVDEIVSAVGASGIGAAQLHGDESADFCRELQARLPGLQVIKAFRTDAGFVPEVAARYPAHALLIDAACEGYGGSGLQANWEKARRAAELVSISTGNPTLVTKAATRVGHPASGIRSGEKEEIGAPPSRSGAELRWVLPQLILAGGLTANNVVEAIRRVQPHAVDVCSGVEAGKGRKDSAKMRDFFAAVRLASLVEDTV
jgi:phosphoribosylanthranilate isomerase